MPDVPSQGCRCLKVAEAVLRRGSVESAMKPDDHLVHEHLDGAWLVAEAAFRRLIEALQKADSLPTGRPPMKDVIGLQRRFETGFVGRNNQGKRCTLALVEPQSSHAPPFGMLRFPPDALMFKAGHASAPIAGADRSAAACHFWRREPDSAVPVPCSTGPVPPPPKQRLLEARTTPRPRERAGSWRR